ncbi:O-antigen ligase family protein [Streptococcus hongkongensis]|nr:hypothetical protein NC01_08290 [Streptococcus uberis]
MKINRYKLSIQSLFHLFNFFIFLFLICEFLYNGINATGYHNLTVAFTTLIISVLNFSVVNLKRIQISYFNVLSFLTLIGYVLYFGHFSYVSFFYTIMLINIILISESKIRLENYFWIFILILGFILSTYQKLSGVQRVVGFFSTSPTIFSLIILYSCVLILDSEKIAYFLKVMFTSLGLVSIILTESRSTFFVFLLFIFYYLIYLPIKGTARFSAQSKLLFLGGVLLFFIVIFLTFLVNIKLRENGIESSNSRKMVIEYFFYEIKQNPIRYIIGRGAGYTSQVVPRLLGLNLQTYPLHQDILMWFVEYGIFGFFLLVISLTYQKHINWKVVILIALSSFHNLFTSSILIIFLCILNNEIIYNTRKAEKNDRNFCYNSCI